MRLGSSQIDSDDMLFALNKVATPCSEAPQDAFWLPVRGPATYLGCSYQNCDGYHPYWALDFNPPDEYTATGANGQGERINVYSVGNGTAYITDISQDGTCAEPDGSPTFYHPSNQIAIDHGNGVITSYTHLNEILISNGQQVTKDTVLGTIGTAGATFPCPFAHLHFEKWEGSSMVESTNGIYLLQGGERKDPGTLLGCQDGSLVNYPQALELSNWNSLADPNLPENRKWIQSS